MNDKNNKNDNKDKQLTCLGGNLARHNGSGIYYLLATVGGKRKTKSLRTSDLSTAKELRDDMLKGLRKALEAGTPDNSGLTLDGALKLHEAELKRRSELPPNDTEFIAHSTYVNYTGSVAQLRELAKRDLNKPLRKCCTVEGVKAWLHPVNLAKKSASHYNNLIINLRYTYELGKRHHACLSNPAVDLTTRTTRRATFTPLRPDQWQALLQAIRDGGGSGLEKGEQKKVMRRIVTEFKNAKGETDFAAAFTAHPEWQQELGLGPNPDKEAWRRIYVLAYYVRRVEGRLSRRGMESADLVEFLTYTGARIGETRKLTWSDIDMEARTINFPQGIVKGQTRSKTVPIIKALAPVLERCRARAEQRGDERVFGIKNCNDAIATACEKLELPHTTQHKLRHMFITGLLKIGMSAEKAAALAGHSDGGKTVRAVYAHLVAEDAREDMEALPYAQVAAANTKEQEIAALKARLAALEGTPANVVPLNSAVA